MRKAEDGGPIGLYGTIAAPSDAPEGIDGSIEIMADRPWTSQGGKYLGSIELRADMPKTPTELTAFIDTVQVGQHAIFFKFKSPTKEQSLCTLHDFVFTE